MSRPQENNPDEVFDWDGFFKELDSESQRGGILVGAAALDELLRRLIKAFLIDDKVAKGLLNGPDRPLSSFSARIQLAYSLGLISPDEKHDLDIIRKIRNKFAHSLHGLSFKNEWVINECRNLRVPKKFEKQSDALKNASPGDLLYFTIAILAHNQLPMYALQAKRERRQIKKDWDFIGGTKVEQKDKPT